MALILRRRTFVVNRKLQVSVLLTSLGHIVLLVVVLSVALFLPLVAKLQLVDVGSSEASEAALRLLYLHDVYWLPVLLTLVAIALHSVWASHKIAGPIYRFRRACEAMASGVVPRPVTLRKDDQLQAERDVVNGMLDTWRRFVEDAQRDSARLRDALDACGPAPDGRLAPSSKEWDEVLHAHQQLAATLGRATCEPGPTDAVRGAADRRA